MHQLARIAYSRVGHDHESAEASVQSWLANDSFALAYRLWQEGFSVIPLVGGKFPAVKWKRYQTERCSLADLVAWFCDNRYTPGIVTGELSGITVIDCDSPAAVDEWKDIKRYAAPPIATQRTKRGQHFVYPHRGERNTVRVGGLQKVDRRGEGGYVKAYPDAIAWKRPRRVRSAVA